MNKQEVIRQAIEDLKACKPAMCAMVAMEKELDMAISALEQQLSGWIPCKDRLPEDDNPVLVTARYKEGARGYFIYRACYVAPKTRTTEDYGWDRDNIDTDYDEEHDCYWIPECWYEDNAVEDNGNWILDDDYEILAWQPLPEPYKELATDNNVVTKSGKDNNALAIGDKIRESNESLAEFIKNVTDKCIRGKCLECQLYKACDHEDNAKDIEDYLNQPYTDTIN